MLFHSGSLSCSRSYSLVLPCNWFKQPVPAIMQIHLSDGSSWLAALGALYLAYVPLCLQKHILEPSASKEVRPVPYAQLRREEGEAELTLTSVLQLPRFLLFFSRPALRSLLSRLCFPLAPKKLPGSQQAEKAQVDISRRPKSLPSCKQGRQLVQLPIQGYK